jgi:hypothetical protein
MASINSLGGKPERSADLTIIMYRMVTSPLFSVRSSNPRTASAGWQPGSIDASNEAQRNRQLRYHFCPSLRLSSCVWPFVINYNRRKAKYAPRLRLRGLSLQIVAQRLLSGSFLGRKDLGGEIAGLI